MQWIADDHWSVDNPNPNAAYPRLGMTKADVTNNVQPQFILVAQWKLPPLQDVWKSVIACLIAVSTLSGDNLAVFSPFKLWDPELAWNAYPLSTHLQLWAFNSLSKSTV